MHEKLLIGSREENHSNLVANAMQKIVYFNRNMPITLLQSIFYFKIYDLIFQCLQMSGFNSN